MLLFTYCYHSFLFSECMSGISYMGHNSRITDVCFSHHSSFAKQMLLSPSSDGTARIWKGNRVDSSAVVFSHHKHNPQSQLLQSNLTTFMTSAATGMGGDSGGMRNKPFGCEISAAKFYYMDKFVLLVCMYAYMNVFIDS